MKGEQSLKGSKMKQLTAKKYRELFKLRAEGKLDDMECTKSLYKLLEKLYSPGMKILDIPCGVGHYFRKIKGLGEIEYLGVDLDSKAIALAREIWGGVPNAKFEVQDITKLDLEDSSMDVVYCYNLLLHLKDYEKPLAELFRVSKRYLLVRSLFDEKASVRKVEVSKDYLKVYKSGFAYYNTYAREEVTKFLRNLGPCKVRFIKEDLKVPQESLERQAKLLKVKVSEFAKGKTGQKQDFRGMALNYEVLFVEKAVKK